ncbi:hypothetical protein [Serratia sp. TMDUHS_CL]|uniref:hypothetical protein n=1 Tax=Serratia sp. TMDUHS_CL TaxID=3128862 RepID=UPI003016E866
MKKTIFALCVALYSTVSFSEDNAQFLTNKVDSLCDDVKDKELCVNQVYTLLYMANIEGKMAGNCEATNRKSPICLGAINTTDYLEKKFNKTK